MNVRYFLSKAPAWFLQYLVWRDKRLGMAGHFQHEVCWAGVELWLRAESRGTTVYPDRPCSCDYSIGENCEVCNP